MQQDRPAEPRTAGGALSGLLVADFSRVLAGPLASMLLADLGATVIKVERPPTGDETRQWGPPYVGSLTAYYCSVNRNKRSIELDFSVPADLALAHRLANRADVFIENFLPGKLESFGLDYEALHGSNPRAVYCSISGFGGDSSLPGYDFVVQAVGGLMSVTGQPDGPPTKAGVPFVDVLTGLHATIGILAALHERDTSGVGQRVEVNLLSSLLGSLINQGTGYINSGPEPSRLGNVHPTIAPYETFEASDAPLAAAGGNDRQFRALVETVGLPELADDPRFANNAQRLAHRAELRELLEGALATDTAAGWAARLQAVGVPCGPVNTIGSALEFATKLGLDPVVRFDPADGDPGIATLANPLRLSATPVHYHRPPPALGADSAEIRSWLESDSIDLADD